MGISKNTFSFRRRIKDEVTKNRFLEMPLYNYILTSSKSIMQKVKFKITGMTCEHCGSVNKINCPIIQAFGFSIPIYTLTFGVGSIPFLLKSPGARPVTFLNSLLN